MGRRPRFSTDEILDAALELVIAGGPAAATATAVGRAIGAPSGSVYHRFASRDEMMARLWLRTIENYQRPVIEAVGVDDLDAAADAAIAHCFDWTTEHRGEAALLLLYDKSDIAAAWPDTLARELREHNHAARAALRAYARRRYGSDDPAVMDRVTYALVDLPYAAVRRHLPDRGLPAQWLREFTIRSAHEILTDIGA
ncbi:TetR family transcriptional regulator [Gordonia sp. CPCC 206044]|uniref:TetR family transcriptional regulator n=1 Tax=Gordonia sp. CPCC 206044 TaxID=3140793 RepID=UPI003AF338DA